MFGFMRKHFVSKAVHRVGNLAYRAELRLAQPTKVGTRNPLDLASGINLIRTTPISKLSQATFIERELLLALGLNNECVNEQPSALADHLGKGFGWRIWQYPNQFSKYLSFLSSVAPLINSYAEIGSRYGGTFVVTCEYLARFNPGFRTALAVDLIDESELLRQYHRHREFEYFQGNSADTEFTAFMADRHYDLVLIDGDHSFSGALKDFDVMRGARTIAFHDIMSRACPDLTIFWNSVRYFLKSGHEFHEFTEQYEDVSDGPFLGIGVMRRK